MHKNDSQVVNLFTLSGSMSIKAARKMLVKFVIDGAASECRIALQPTSGLVEEVQVARRQQQGQHLRPDELILLRK